MRTLKKGGMYFKRMSFIIGSFVLLVILFCCSAFFSASETSLFSLSPLKVRHLEKHGGATGRIIARLLAHPSRLLVTILMGNEVVNILASSTAAALWIRLLGDDLGSVTATVSMVFLLLIFGEVTPKTYAVRFPEWFASFACRPLLLLSYVNFPVRVILTGIADGILRLLGGTRTGHERIWTGQEFRTMLDVSERDNDREMIPFIEHELMQRLVEERPPEAPGSARLSRRLKHFPITPSVRIESDDKAAHFVLSIVAADRPGLLYAVATALAQHGATLHTAKIATLGERVEDTFLVSGGDLNQSAGRISLESELLEQLKV